MSQKILKDLAPRPKTVSNCLSNVLWSQYQWLAMDPLAK